MLAARMRFVQYLRKGDLAKRLGLLADDQKSLVELAGVEGVPNDLKTLIAQNPNIEELAKKVQKQPTLALNDDVTLLPPLTDPGKIICIGLNYQDHCDEQNKPAPKEPMFFSKFNNTLVGPTDNVIAHKSSEKIDWEVELVCVIGKVARHVPKDQAMDYVFGYSIAQDISARDWQKERNGGQFLIGKSMDTFLPLGPAVVHKSLVKNVYDLNLKTWINGVEKQNGNTGNLIFKLDDVINRLTETITLLPGDIIVTGTPKGVGMHRNPPEFLKAGDVIKSEIVGLGTMTNKVVAS
ncbi:fumarylacetoacetate hydrolase domain-containing protein 2 [Drosophila guanche]|uniref:Blast:Fumarylacetoacetate hydrolase domain-containing protein 2 n=1 Tax=Drosophila guanche TaxID=7266 RepID=A0A3B0JPT8_DROGU|nr:fumarylacetoacetate hydrolase domain-containing protein 2 [Drosophila guanche]SPP82923.1 blast:Fumarylacetoacetate hydrolase domain-containing protein 2 [Drosophila guanche]